MAFNIGDKVVVTRTVRSPGRQVVQEGTKGKVLGITGQGKVIIRFEEYTNGRMKRVTSLPSDTLRLQ